MSTLVTGIAELVTNDPSRGTGRLGLVTDAAVRLDRVLTNDPGTGVMRHADAGYDLARDVARTRGVDLPML